MTKWEGDILSYKDHLKAKVMKESNKAAKSESSRKTINRVPQDVSWVGRVLPSTRFTYLV